MSSAPLSFDFPDRLAGRRVSIVIVAADGKLQLPKELYAHIMCPLNPIECQKWFLKQCFFTHHRRQQALPPLGSVVAECVFPCGRVRLMFPCVASGAAAAARVLCCALRLSCQCLLALCV
jgi:hypothetical protein